MALAKRNFDLILYNRQKNLMVEIAAKIMTKVAPSINSYILLVLCNRPIELTKRYQGYIFKSFFSRII